MVRRKSVRTRGKFSFFRYFQKFDEGDRVSFVQERSIKSNVPKRMHGRTGKILSKRGRHYIVLIKDHSKEKEYIIHPVHLKKVKN